MNRLLIEFVSGECLSAAHAEMDTCVSKWYAVCRSHRFYLSSDCADNDTCPKRTKFLLRQQNIHSFL